jgi:succinate-acetate transporter protein
MNKHIEPISKSVNILFSHQIESEPHYKSSKLQFYPYIYYIYTIIFLNSGSSFKRGKKLIHIILRICRLILAIKEDIQQELSFPK